MDKKKNYFDISSSIVTKEVNETDTAASEQKDVNYWRSFSELYNDPEFQRIKAKEFDKEAGKDFEVSKMSGFSRRKFLALMSASAALAAAGCSNYREKGELIPYNQKPEEITIGVPTFFASTLNCCENNCGVIVKTREGRPVKLDGNPDHPVNQGKICAKGQASIMGLYEPDRLKTPFRGETEIAWKEADAKIIEALKGAASSGKEIAIISHTISSPTFRKVLADFTTAYPTAKVYTYELINDTPKNNAFARMYGNKLYPSIKYDQAKVILALESDFLGTEGNKVANARLYSRGRDVMTGEEFNRLYAVEGSVSLTGLNADYRVRLRTDAIEEFVMCLLNELVNKRRSSAIAVDGGVASGLSKYSLEDFAKKYSIKPEVLNHLVEDFTKNRGRSYVSAGSKLPESTHIAVNLLNEVLGASALYTLNADEASALPLSPKQEIDTLIANMNAGKVGAVIHCDSNPAYHFLSSYNYPEAVKKVPMVVTITELPNESSALSTYTLPGSHALEAWGDYRSNVGFYSFQQPVISPLYQNRQKEAVLLTWARQNPDAYNEQMYHDYMKEHWRTTLYPALNAAASFDNLWFSALHDGIVLSPAVPAPVLGALNQQPVSEAMGRAMTAGTGFILLLNESHSIGDGRYAGNGWLQELPSPITKIVWDNYAMVSVDTAKELGIDSNSLIDITVDGKKQTVPVFVQPGMADKVLSIEMGYGRTVAGAVGEGIGVDVNILRSANPALTERFYNNVQVSAAGGTYELVSTQEHYPIDHERYKDIQFKRDIIREATYLEYKANPGIFKAEEEKEDELRNFPSINDEHKYVGVKWGMAIDLNKCLGCGECTIACNVENNIPIVGKDQVAVNREMHWLRLDRYYSGTPQEVKANFQPMLCQHCDFAPCENVCPVAATTHSPDGINGMAYNRCVGTRYCSNNCPYKVRRFNYFNFRDRFADAHLLEQPFNLMYNPEVTVRSRGVMEKCTFCVQRIMAARQAATQEGRQLKGTDVKTACQEACSTNAILFGDINDEKSELHKQREHNLAYYVLNEIKTRPNISYISKLRNTYEPNHHMEESH
jgi:molybdopterin-containing oxidoreductase family iron-sulfur binding subunit